MQLALTIAIRTLRERSAPPEVVALVDAQRKDVVLRNFRGFERMHAERAEQYRKTAAHFEAHPNIYRNSTPEIVARYRKLASTEEKDAEIARKCAEKVEAEGIPEEVATFDPWAPWPPKKA